MNNGTQNQNPPQQFEAAAKLPQRDEIRRWAAELGFQSVGFANVDLSEHEPHVRDFVQQGLHGEMGYLARNLDKRLDPAQLQADTVCVVTARMN